VVGSHVLRLLLEIRRTARDRPRRHELPSLTKKLSSRCEFRSLAQIADFRECTTVLLLGTT